MVLVGAVRFARRKRREEQAPVEGFLPPVSVLKPLHGTEPDLRTICGGFSNWIIRSMRFCSVLAMPAIAGLQMAQRVAAEFPAIAREISDLR